MEISTLISRFPQMTLLIYNWVGLLVIFFRIYQQGLDHWISLFVHYWWVRFIFLFCIILRLSFFSYKANRRVSWFNCWFLGNNSRLQLFFIIVVIFFTIGIFNQIMRLLKFFSFKLLLINLFCSYAFAILIKLDCFTLSIWLVDWCFVVCFVDQQNRVN